MVRKYTRKTDNRAYGCAALVAIQQGQPVKTAARQYNIPPKTLRRHRDGHVRAPGAVQLGRNVPVLPHQFEEQLVRYIQIMESQVYALTTTDVQHLTYELTEWQNLQHPFDRNTHMARKDWMWSFMARHPTLTIGDFTKYGQPVPRPDPTWGVGIAHFQLWGWRYPSCAQTVPFFLRMDIFSQYGEIINSINPRDSYIPLAWITTDPGNGLVSSLCQAIAWTNFDL